MNQRIIGLLRRSKHLRGEDSVESITKAFTLGYMLIFSLLVTLIVTMNLRLHQLGNEAEQITRLVNKAGAQRTLSQRIYWLTEELSHSSGNPALLKQTIDQFEDNHRLLVYGKVPFGMPPGRSEALRSYYFEAPHNVDIKVREYVNLARSGLILGVDETLIEDMRALASSSLLDSLDATVQAYENLVAKTFAKQQTFELITVGGLVLVMGLAAILIFRPLVHRVRLYTKQLYEFATKDAMTRLFNRHHFLNMAHRSHGEGQRYGFPISVVMFDIDRFKSVNDIFGHATG